jgi:hypothetical protein
MPLVLVEGKSDEQSLNALKRRGLLAEDVKPRAPKPEEPGGREDFAARVEGVLQTGVPVIALLDLDEADAAANRSAFHDHLVGHFADRLHRDGAALWTVRTPVRDGRVALALAGEPEDERIPTPVVRRTMDDHLLRLVLAELTQVAALRDCAVRDAVLVARKFDETVRLYVSQGIAVDTSKKRLQILRTVLGHDTSRGVFAERVIEAAGIDAVKDAYGGLCAGISAAAASLSISPSS